MQSHLVADLRKYSLIVFYDHDGTSGVNFINILRTNFSYENHFGSFFYVHVTREMLRKQRSYKK